MSQQCQHGRNEFTDCYICDEMPKRVIRPNDLLQDKQGNLWKVLRTLPGGKLELFDKAKSRFLDCYRPHVANWQKVEVS